MLQALAFHESRAIDINIDNKLKTTKNDTTHSYAIV